MRVLKWIIDRADGRAAGQQTLFGIGPAYGELNWSGLDFSPAQFATVTRIDQADWAEEFKLHEELFERLAPRLPPALAATKAALQQRLAALG